MAKDVTEIFRGKTAQQLDELKAKIEQKLESKSDGVDIGYWESLLSQLKAHMARARLKDKHQENLRSKLEILKQEQMETSNLPEENPDELPSTSTQIKDEPESVAEDTAHLTQEVDDEARNILSDSFNLYSEGNYSPTYLKEEEMESNIRIIDGDQLDENIEKCRTRILNQEDEDDFATKEEIRMAKEARKGMNTDEAEFSVETRVDPQVYLWSDKYRPRKPRYFNRVHTGFEWNKYNQTHYDMDNPPPKIVQGYKFNIFYPDLINKTSTPQYFLVSIM